MALFILWDDVLMFDILIFLRRFLSNPRRMGSMAPSSRFLARAVSEIVRKLDFDNLIELGPGTGAITSSLVDLCPVLVEIDPHLAARLRLKFPSLKVYNRCALDHLSEISGNTGVVVSIPLINNPFTHTFIESLKNVYDTGSLSWIIIYTYGRHNPLERVGFKSSIMKCRVLKNFPPAYVWLYK